MKARELKSILNDTRYTVHNIEDKVCVGSPLCSDLISLDKKTFKIKYALDTWGKGRGSLASDGKSELLFIWDKLQELVDDGRISDIINGNDILESPLLVFTCINGVLIETTTDAYGWPNVTVSGEMMHNNDYFKTKIEAIVYGIEDLEAGISMYERHLKEREEEVQKIKDRICSDKLLLKNIVAIFDSEPSGLEP